MARKPRNDSVESVSAAFAEAGIAVDPPKHVRLRQGDLPFWADITGAKPPSAWTPIDKAHAANLARTLYDIECLQEELEHDGYVVYNDRGTMTANPKHSILETLSRRAVTLSRTLQVHAHATQGPSKDQARQNKQHEAAKGALQDAGDELIARPMH